ncbi:hypothetical protein LSAT2_024262 [Lamellibrachia satsuma]|nr:hypothetical protein LSAT2_024262 [Lamellibrachia satsuma]
MYTFGSVVYDAIGETELQQYIRFRKYNPKFIFVTKKVKIAKPPAGYKYHVKALSSTEILIEESNGKAPTGGGSSFLVRTDSVSTQICHYDDFFNGTYVAHCPLPECTCRNINVWLQHANYTAFTSVHYPIEKLLWRKRVCDLHKGNAGFTKTPRESKTSSNGKNIVTWYLENRLWITRSVSGKRYIEMRKSDVCGCIRKIRKLFCFGASHMRYKSAYIASTCYNVPANVTVRFKSLTVENVRFRTLSKVSHYQVLWKKYLKNETLGQRDVVLIQTVAHDMKLGGMQPTMDVAVMQLVRVLSDLQMKSLKYGFRLIFITTPPFPQADKTVPSVGSRNNFALAALNRRLKTELLSKKVNVFDEFSILLPQQNRNSCGCHFMCRGIKNNKTYIYGRVGIVAASMLVYNEIC